MPMWYVTTQFLLFLFFGFGVTALYRSRIQKINFPYHKVKQVLWEIFKALFILACCVMIYDFFVDQLHFKKTFSSEPMYVLTLLGYLIDGFVIFSPWFLLYHLYKYGQHTGILEKVKAQQEADLHKAKIEALLNKMNPHFLFNTLNTIRWMIVSDSDKARLAVDHLSEIIRYTTRTTDSPMIPIQKELAIIERYLQIEQWRFEDLEYHIEADQRLQHMQIPMFLVLNLVENAITHGVSQVLNHRNLKLSVYAFNNEVFIEVLNSGKLSDAKKGFGLASIETLLQHSFGQNASIDLKAQEDSVISTVRIPYYAV